MDYYALNLIKEFASKEASEFKINDHNFNLLSQFDQAIGN